MRTLVLVSALTTLATVAHAQQPANPFGADGCWTGQQWVTKSHPLCPKTSQYRPVSGSPVPPIEDEYELVEPYPGSGFFQPVLMRTKDSRLWFKVGKSYRFAYDLTIKVVSMDYRCAQVSQLYVCDYFHVANVVDQGGMVGEGTEVGAEMLFRLFSPQGNWTELPQQ